MEKKRKLDESISSLPEDIITDINNAISSLVKLVFTPSSTKKIFGFINYISERCEIKS